MNPGYRDARLLVNRSRLDELEKGGFRFELGSIGALHVKGACHRTKGRRKWTARRVFKRLTGFEGWLLTDDAGSVDFLGMSGAVDDGPMTIPELNGCVSDVRNADRVEEEPATRRWVAVLGRIMRSDLNPDARSFRIGGGFEMIAVGHVGNTSSSSRISSWTSRRSE